MTNITEAPPARPHRLAPGRALVSHVFAYCVGVCLFASVNMLLGGPAWFQWPSLAWGVVLVGHVLAVVTGLVGAGRPSPRA
jgi:hypothetical protein